MINEEDTRSMGSLSPVPITADEEKAQYQKAMRMFKAIDQKIQSKTPNSVENSANGFSSSNFSADPFMKSSQKDSDEGLVLLPSTGKYRNKCIIFQYFYILCFVFDIHFC